MGENSAAARARSVNKRAQPRCVLVDWSGSDENVAEGRILSSDPEDFVNDIPLGPLAVKVWVDTAIKSDAFLWRPATGMFNVEQAVGEMIAWPASRCVVSDEGINSEDIPLKSPNGNSLNSCKLLSPWSTNEDVVAEGRWQCQEPNALVNGLPLGPNAVKVFVDVVHEPETFLWRPIPEMTYLGDSLKHFVAWPVSKCMFQNTQDSPRHRSLVQNQPSPRQESTGKSGSPSAAKKSPIQISQPPSPKASPKKTQALSPIRRSLRHSQNEVAKENQKCKLMSITGKKQVVAEGRWASDNPDQTVHFVPLGPNAVKVWIDVVKVTKAEVWRTSSEIECVGDAIGTAIAWPKEKVILC